MSWKLKKGDRIKIIIHGVEYTVEVV